VAALRLFGKGDTRVKNRFLELVHCSRGLQMWAGIVFLLSRFCRQWLVAEPFQQSIRVRWGDFSQHARKCSQCLGIHRFIGPISIFTLLCVHNFHIGNRRLDGRGRGCRCRGRGGLFGKGAGKLYSLGTNAGEWNRDIIYQRQGNTICHRLGI